MPGRSAIQLSICLTAQGIYSAIQPSSYSVTYLPGRSAVLPFHLAVQLSSCAAALSTCLAT